jgi:hypothetical protein
MLADLYYGDVHIGTIAMTRIRGAGLAGSIRDRTRASARPAPLRPSTRRALGAWRHQRDWTAEKYRRFDCGERMPHDWRPSAA